MRRGNFFRRPSCTSSRPRGADAKVIGTTPSVNPAPTDCAFKRQTARRWGIRLPTVAVILAGRFGRHSLRNGHARTAGRSSVIQRRSGSVLACPSLRSFLLISLGRSATGISSAGEALRARQLKFCAWGNHQNDRRRRSWRSSASRARRRAVALAKPAEVLHAR